MRILTTMSSPKAQQGISQAGIPEIGRIGLGVIEEKNGKQFPSATDHFVPRGPAAELFETLYGKGPKSLPICFYSDVEESSCSTRLEIRDRKGDLFSYSDGESYYFRPKDGSTRKFTRMVTKTARPSIAQDTAEFLQQGMQPDKAKYIVWKPTLYLRFLIRDFPQMGYWQIVTNGESSTIPQITEMVDTWKELLGSLSLVPFSLVIKQAKTRTNKRFTYMNLVPDFSLAEAMQLAKKRAIDLPSLPNMSLLESRTNNAPVAPVEELQVYEAIPVDTKR